MARSQLGIQSNPAMQHSGVQPLDTVNGQQIVGLGRNDVSVLLQQYPLHVIIVSTTTGSVIVRAGNPPFAPQASQGDLTIAVTANTPIDIGPQIVLQRHLVGAAGDLAINLDYTGLTAGSILVALGYSANVPANTAANTIIKHVPGYMLAAYVTTLGTAALSHVDHQGGSAGNTLHTIPGSAAVGSLYTPAQKTQQGLTAVGVASGPAVTVIYT